MKKTVFVLLPLLVGGCASMSPRLSNLGGSDPAVARPSDVVNNSLVKSAAFIRLDMSRISAIGEPEAPAALPGIDGSKFRGVMAKSVDIDYDGDISVFMKDVAGMGVRSMVVGRHPAMDVVVSLHYVKTPLWKVLLDAGVQIGNFGTMQLGPESVTLQYSGGNAR